MTAIAETNEMIEALGLYVDLARRGVELVSEGSTLHYRPRSAVSAETVERMRRLKPALLAYVRGQSELEDEIDPSDPCPQCGSLATWWTMQGAPPCLRCDPPIKAVKTLRTAAAIHKRTGRPANHRCDEMAAELANLSGFQKY